MSGKVCRISVQLADIQEEILDWSNKKINVSNNWVYALAYKSGAHKAETEVRQSHERKHNRLLLTTEIPESDRKRIASSTGDDEFFELRLYASQDDVHKLFAVLDLRDWLRTGKDSEGVPRPGTYLLKKRDERDTSYSTKQRMQKHMSDSKLQSRGVKKADISAFVDVYGVVLETPKVAAPRSATVSRTGSARSAGKARAAVSNPTPHISQHSSTATAEAKADGTDPAASVAKTSRASPAEAPRKPRTPATAKPASTTRRTPASAESRQSARPRPKPRPEPKPTDLDLYAWQMIENYLRQERGESWESVYGDIDLTAIKQQVAEIVRKDKVRRAPSSVRSTKPKGEVKIPEEPARYQSTLVDTDRSILARRAKQYLAEMAEIDRKAADDGRITELTATNQSLESELRQLKERKALYQAEIAAMEDVDKQLTAALELQRRKANEATENYAQTRRQGLTRRLDEQERWRQAHMAPEKKTKQEARVVHAAPDDLADV
ncbi:hypothetical protein J8273_6644 [Carpediemonas membranifera]|uniref:Uncharacterized protein n=1 Tax=Carpediemonas membranifera TaxID=201153 RepID=A0A8J6ARF1_9EUKA|nr:hypothetical protein J8273_6644 [Carpediemonas membranifera]|eukprot:KAG9392053.1 hypothetical protein J8273_6644 [Carpediemonas membranifera]